MSARVAVVTGFSGGIGKATADLLRRRGLRVIGLSRNIKNAESTRRCDVTCEDEVRRVLGSIARICGRLDVLVNCAGTAHSGNSLDISAQDWEEVFRTNVLGSYLCCKYAVIAMRRRRWGRIVNLSSIAGRSYSRLASAAYTSSKYAVIGLTKHLAGLLGKDGITVNCVCPSQTQTPMLERTTNLNARKALAAAHPMGRLAQAEEVAQAIAFLASQEASYVNGACLDVNGGLL